MAASKGKLFLIQVGSGSPLSYTSIAEARSNGLTINNSQVDVTTKASGGWTELLEGAGITSMQLSCSGVWQNSAHEKLVAAAAVSNSFLPLKLVNAAGETFVGNFAVSSYGRGGEHNGEETFTATFDSAGEIDYTPAS